MLMNCILRSDFESSPLRLGIVSIELRKKKSTIALFANQLFDSVGSLWNFEVASLIFSSLDASFTGNQPVGRIYVRLKKAPPTPDY